MKIMKLNQPRKFYVYGIKYYRMSLGALHLNHSLKESCVFTKLI